ncbi:MAG: hypothetical protein HN344_01630 [Gammaproteobacteria bacterium]|nr:hypothetical protein [Gammaproteobacteria bacterium]
MSYSLLHPLPTPRSQRGSTLVLSLLLLTLMSMLGLGAMEAALLEEKMASNFRFSTAAQYAAEAGLQQALNNHQNRQLATSFGGVLGESQFSTTVSRSGATYTVQSVGLHPHSGSRRTLTMQLSGATGAAPTIESWFDHE